MAMSFGSYSSRVVATRVVALDGTGDFTDIQSAINDLPSGGGVIYIKEGTYTVTSTINVTSNIALIGAGGCTTIQGSGVSNVISCSGVYNILISQLRIYGGSNGLFLNSCTSITIEDCIFQGSSNGIYVSGGLYASKISNCQFYGPVIGTDQLTWTQINNCVFWQCNGTAISIANAWGVNIYSNGFYECKYSICIYGGNPYFGCCANTISNNSIQDGKVRGIEIHSISNTTITGNVVDGIVYDAILLYYCSNCVVSGNYINSQLSDGIVLWDNCDNNVITSNRCTGCSQYGIDIRTASCENNLVVANHLTGNNLGSLNDAGTGTLKANNYT